MPAFGHCVPYTVLSCLFSLIFGNVISLERLDMIAFLSEYVLHRRENPPSKSRKSRGYSMKLNYNVIGEQRKSLVGAISRKLNLPIKYLKAPTFAYEVGSYHIDKTGTITGPDSLDLENACISRALLPADANMTTPTPVKATLAGWGRLTSIPTSTNTTQDSMQTLMHQLPKPCKDSWTNPISWSSKYR